MKAFSLLNSKGQFAVQFIIGFIWWEINPIKAEVRMVRLIDSSP